VSLTPSAVVIVLNPGCHHTFGILDMGYIVKAISKTLCQCVIVGAGKGQSFYVKDQAGQRLKLCSTHFIKCTRYSHTVPYLLTK
jgi:hypothetical protein